MTAAAGTPVAGGRLRHDVDLRARNSFGVAARAPLLLELDDAAQLPSALAHPALGDRRPLVLGGGSNLLFAGDPGLPLLQLRDAAIAVVADDGDRVVVRAGAGAGWHDLVAWTLDRGLGGLENLALIPGTVGAAPIQNIGAYGIEAGERIVAVEAWDHDAGRVRRLDAADCGFAYRDSRFKHEDGRWIVLAVEFTLSRSPELRLDYAGIGGELEAMGIVSPTAADVGAAVVRLRRSKLPDPAVVGNAGSFFKNPIVPAAQATALRADHPALPVYPVAPFPAQAARDGDGGDAGDDGDDAPGHHGDARAKLSAAWLIDACGWKGHRDGDAGISDRHALVLVNHGDATGAQLLALARRVAGSVHDRFGVAIEPEPRIIGDRW